MVVERQLLVECCGEKTTYALSERQLSAVCRCENSVNSVYSDTVTFIQTAIICIRTHVSVYDSLTHQQTRSQFHSVEFRASTPNTSHKTYVEQLRYECVRVRLCVILIKLLASCPCCVCVCCS